MVFGVVEDTLDPLERGRIRVRIFGIHTDNKQEIPTDALPWCNVAGSTFSASISGFGLSGVGLVEGSMISGIFLNPETMQEIIILHSWGGARQVFQNPSSGFNDPNGVFPLPEYKQDMNNRTLGIPDEDDAKAKTTITAVTVDKAVFTASADSFNPDGTLTFGPIKSLVDDVKNGVGGIVDTINDAKNEYEKVLADAIKSVTEVIDDVQEEIIDAYNKANGIISDVVDEVKETANGVVTDVRDSVKNITTETIKETIKTEQDQTING